MQSSVDVVSAYSSFLQSVFYPFYLCSIHSLIPFLPLSEYKCGPFVGRPGHHPEGAGERSREGGIRYNADRYHDSISVCVRLRK